MRSKKMSVLLLCVGMAACLCSCRASTDTTGTEVNTKVKTEEQEISGGGEEKQKLTLEEWGGSLNYDEPKTGIWNNEKGEGKILESTEEYALLPEDIFVIYTPEKIPSTALSLEELPIVEKLEFFENKKMEKIILVNFTLPTKIKAVVTVIMGGKEYPLEVCLAPGEGYVTADQMEAQETGEGQTFASLESWGDTLEYDTPQFGIWNSGTGKGAILDVSRTYHIKEGDQFITYMPERYERVIYLEGPNMIDNPVKVGKCTAVNYDFKARNLIEISFEEEWGSFTNNILLLYADGEDNAEEMTNQEWVDSLLQSEPAFIVWNLISGERKVLENGSTYQLKEGDKTGFFYTDKYTLNYLPVAMEGEITDTSLVWNYVFGFTIPDSESVTMKQVLKDGGKPLELSVTFTK